MTTLSLPLQSEQRASDEAQSVRLIAAIAVWSLAALLYSTWRIPFDEEWFSIELALQTDWDRFLSTLRQDVHLPWVALLDRGAGALGGRFGITMLHVGASAGALWLVARTAERRVGIPGWLVALAGFHPMLMLYGGALGWYPFLLLAQALRMYGVWCDRRGHFAAGALLGSLVSVVDLPFLLHDIVWLMARAPKERRRAAIGLASISLVMPLLCAAVVHTLWQIKIATGMPLIVTIKHAVRFIAAGTFGEGHPGAPWMVLALAVPLAAWIGWWTLARRRLPIALWMALVLAGWLATTLKGVWNPRYGLMFTLLACTAMMSLYRAGRAGQLLGLLAGGYLLLGLTQTVRGEGMLKKDLNTLSPADCAALLPGPGTETVVALSPEVGARLKRCGRQTQVLVIDKLPTYLAEEDAASGVSAQIATREQLTLVSWLSPQRDKLTLVAERLHTLLAQRQCRQVGRTHLVPIAHYTLKRVLKPELAPYRFYREQWECQPQR